MNDLEDRALFARVWSRVAPGEDCPVELKPPEGPSCPLPRRETATGGQRPCRRRWGGRCCGAKKRPPR